MGDDVRDSGHSRVPAPPAGITAQRFSITGMVATLGRRLPRVARMTTFSAVLEGLLRGDAGRPLVTFYDHASGERTELSVTTYANWVAKTAGLLADEHDLERGQSLRIDLPTHWLGPVFLGAAWTVGLAVTDGDDADAYVCGPDGLDRWARTARDAVVLASALQPLGTRFTEPLPPGVHDYGVEVWSQPDAWVAFDPPGPHDLAFGDDHPRGAVGRGRRRRCPRRRRPRPHRGEPGFPVRAPLLHRAARSRRLAGPRGQRGPGPARRDVRRRARHRPFPPG